MDVSRYFRLLKRPKSSLVKTLLAGVTMLNFLKCLTHAV